MSSWLGDVIVYIHTSRPRLAPRVLLPVVGSYEVRAGEVVVNQWSREQRTQRDTTCDGFNRFPVFRYPWFPIRGNVFASRLEVRSGISRNWCLAVLRDVQTSVYGIQPPGSRRGIDYPQDYSGNSLNGGEHPVRSGPPHDLSADSEIRSQLFYEGGFTLDP